MRREIKKCPYCQKEFFPSLYHSINQKYCSKAHRQYHWKKLHWRKILDRENLRARSKTYKPTPKLCPTCQKEFTPLKYHPYQKYCHWKCRNNGNRLLKPELYKFIKNNGNAHRRSLMRNLTGTSKLLNKYFTFEAWEKMKRIFNYTCPKCKRKEPEIKLTIDHITPLSKGGNYLKDNIQPLCFSCNSSKKDK